MLLVFFFPHPDHRGRFSGGDDSGGGEGRGGGILSVLNTGSEVPSYVRITRWELAGGAVTGTCIKNKLPGVKVRTNQAAAPLVENKNCSWTFLSFLIDSLEKKKLKKSLECHKHSRKLVI